MQDDTRMKVVFLALGAITELHRQVDQVREGRDSQNPVDHNIEQAQIALEVANMRLQQVAKIVQDRMEEDGNAKQPEEGG